MEVEIKTNEFIKYLKQTPLIANAWFREPEKGGKTTRHCRACAMGAVYKFASADREDPKKVGRAAACGWSSYHPLANKFDRIVGLFDETYNKATYGLAGPQVNQGVFNKALNKARNAVIRYIRENFPKSFTLDIGDCSPSARVTRVS